MNLAQPEKWGFCFIAWSMFWSGFDYKISPFWLTVCILGLVLGTFLFLKENVGEEEEN